MADKAVKIADDYVSIADQLQEIQAERELVLIAKGCGQCKGCGWIWHKRYREWNVCYECNNPLNQNEPDHNIKEI